MHECTTVEPDYIEPGYIELSVISNYFWSQCIYNENILQKLGARIEQKYQQQLIYRTPNAAGVPPQVGFPATQREKIPPARPSKWFTLATHGQRTLCGLFRKCSCGG